MATPSQPFQGALMPMVVQEARTLNDKRQDEIGCGTFADGRKCLEIVAYIFVATCTQSLSLAVLLWLLDAVPSCCVVVILLLLGEAYGRQKRGVLS